MRLTLRIAAVLGTALALVLIGRGILQVDQRLEATDRDLRDDQELLAEALAPTLSRTVRVDGSEAARYLVHDLDALRPERGLRWVVIGDAAETRPRDEDAAARALRDTAVATVVVERPYER